MNYIKKHKKTRSEKQSKEFDEELINIVPEQHLFNKASQKILKDEKLKKNKQAKQKGNYRENCTSFHSEERMWCVNESKKNSLAHKLINLKNDRKCQNYLETIENFSEIFLKFLLLISSQPLHCPPRISKSQNLSLKRFNWLLRIINLGTGQKFGKKFTKNFIFYH